MTRPRCSGYDIAKRNTFARLKSEVAAAGRLEFVLQSAIVELLDRAGVPGLRYWHTPNGAKMAPEQAGKMKALGMKAGIPDLILAFADGRMAFVECKSPTGTLSDEQDEFLTDMHAAGHLTAEVRTIDEAIALLASWRAIRKVAA